MMLITKERPDNCLTSAQTYFDFVYEEEWMNDPLVRQMVRDVDGVEMQNPNAGYSPVIGGISVREFSGGLKGLILIYKDEEYRAFSSCIFGDNCAEWMCKLSTVVDFTFSFEHCFNFSYVSALESRPAKDRKVNAKTLDGKEFYTSGTLMMCII